MILGGMLSMFIACNGDKVPVFEPDIVIETGTVALSNEKLMRRYSIDIRGVLPTVKEYQDLASSLDTDAGRRALVQDWMADPRFEERLVYLLGERWHTRIDEFLVFYLEYPPLSSDSRNEYPFERAVGEEPLRLMANIIANNRPWTEVVTADYTFANEVLAQIWPINYPGGAGWKRSTYSDDRPHAGVLSTNGLWWRYYSTLSNYNRARVAAITRLLICEDYTTRTISFSEENGVDSVEDVEDIENALRNNPYCMGCHSALDPIAAALFGFWPANEFQIDELHNYHADREALGGDLLGVEPAWYGDPVSNLSELGRHIALDRRFSECAVESFASLLWRRPVTSSDLNQLGVLHDQFETEFLATQSLLTEIFLTQSYVAGDLETVSAEQSPEKTVRLMTPDQVATVIEDLSGFRWTWEGFDQLDNDSIGYRNLMGGVDGVYVTSPQQEPSLTWLLATQRLAEAAAQNIVLESLGSQNGLLAGVTRSSTSTDAEFRTALQSLHLRLYGSIAQELWLSAVVALWSDINSSAGPEEAWRAVLVAVLRDFSLYQY